MKRAIGLWAWALPLLLAAQAPILPPVSTDFNGGIPLTWGLSTPGSTGWTWSPSLGFLGSAGLVMDCSSCSSVQESTFWSPWLDLSGAPSVNIQFKCAIIAGLMGIPPPIIIRIDNAGGPIYHRVYGFADLIPPPDEVIPHTTNLFPPLDPANVEWVPITYNYFPGLYNDSVRIGFTAWPPFPSYALLDDILIGDFSTDIELAVSGPWLVRNSAEGITLQTNGPIDRVDRIDAAGRVLHTITGSGSDAVFIAAGQLQQGMNLLRVQSANGPGTVKVLR